MEKLKVGLVGLMHANFTGDKEAIFSKAKEDINKFADNLNFNLHIANKQLITEEDAKSVYNELEKSELDFLLVFNAQFASGKIISELADLTEYIGLWAVSETTKAGPLPLNSFCGMNMNASILTEYIGHNKYKWFYGNDDLFLERFKITINALQAVKSLKKKRMALIGGIAQGFDNQYYDERKIRDRFQVDILRNLEFSDLKQRALSYSGSEVNEIHKKMENYASLINVDDKAIENTLRVVKAIKDFSNELDLSGIALECWPKFRMEMDMVACAAIGFLNHLDIVTACEGDVYGLLSMYLLNKLSNKPSLLMDLVDFDRKDQSVQFWHCGVGCPELACGEKIEISPHFNPAEVPDQGLVEHAPVSEMIFKPGQGTITRITKEGEALFLLNGEFFDVDKPGFDGSRGWFKNLKLNDNSIQVKDLVNTIMVKGMQHHYAVGLGDYSSEMLEIAAWLDIKPLEKVDYQDYLQLE